MKFYDKLVRDEIPGIIEDSGKTAVYRVADGNEEFLAYLWSKLDEEVAEFKERPCLEEMADIYEVLQEMARALQYDSDSVRRAQLDKYKDRGGFHNRYILVRVED